VGRLFRVTEEGLTALMKVVDSIMAAWDELSRTNVLYDGSYSGAIEAALGYLLGVDLKKHLYWDEYAAILPVLHNGKRAFLLLLNAGPYAGTCRIIDEGTDQFEGLEASFKLYDLSTEPVLEVVE